MNASMLAGTVLGVALATAGGTYAGYSYINKKPQFAQVTSVTPIVDTKSIPRQECQNVSTTHQKPVKDTHQILGTGLGAVVGGLLGSQIGGGSGKKIATVAGAAGGGYAGNQVQKDMQNKDTYTTTEQRCKTLYDKVEKVVGFQVAYLLNEQAGSVRMDHDPGAQIPVKDGQLVLREAQTAPAPMPAQ